MNEILRKDGSEPPCTHLFAAQPSIFIVTITNGELDLKEDARESQFPSPRHFQRSSGTLGKTLLAGGTDPLTSFALPPSDSA